MRVFCKAMCQTKQYTIYTELLICFHCMWCLNKTFMRVYEKSLACKIQPFSIKGSSLPAQWQSLGRVASLGETIIRVSTPLNSGGASQFIHSIPNLTDAQRMHFPQRKFATTQITFSFFFMRDKSSSLCRVHVRPFRVRARLRAEICGFLWRRPVKMTPTVGTTHGASRTSIRNLRRHSTDSRVSTHGWRTLRTRAKARGLLFSLEHAAHMAGGACSGKCLLWANYNRTNKFRELEQSTVQLKKMPQQKKNCPQKVNRTVEAFFYLNWLHWCKQCSICSFFFY